MLCSDEVSQVYVPAATLYNRVCMAASSSAADLALQEAEERLRSSIIEEVLVDTQCEGCEPAAAATATEHASTEGSKRNLQLWMSKAQVWMELVPDCGHERCASRKTHFDAQDIYNDCVNVLALMESMEQSEAAQAGAAMCPLVHHKVLLCYTGFARDMLHGCTQPGFEQPGKGKRLLAQMDATRRLKRKRKVSKATNYRAVLVSVPEHCYRACGQSPLSTATEHALVSTEHLLQSMRKIPVLSTCYRALLA